MAEAAARGWAGGRREAAAGFQPLPVSARVPWRYVVNYRGDPRRWAAHAPKPLDLDLVGGCALVSVCVLQIEAMGVVGTPAWLRFSTLELLYRLAVTLPGGTRSFVTLRSDVSSRAMSFLGARFSHYLPRRARFAGDAAGLSCVDDAGRTARFGADGARSDAPPAGSAFPSLPAAVAFVLGVDGSVSLGRDGRPRFQPISHPPWDAGFAAPAERQFPLLDELAGGSDLVYDSTLQLREQTQTWQPMRLWRP